MSMRFDRIIQPWVEKSCVDIVTYCREGVCLSHFLVAKIRSPDFPVPVGNMNIMNMFIVTTHTTYCTSKWMGYSGNSIYKWMISATPILRNTHINTHTYIYIQTERYAVRSPFFHVSKNAVFLLHHV